MNYASTLTKAWHLTLENPKIKWLAFIPSFFAVLIFMLEIAWQGYLYLAKFEVVENFLTFENLAAFFQFLNQQGLVGVSILIVVCVLFFMFIVPPWILGTLICCIKQKAEHPESLLSRRKKMVEGLHYFFPLFEFIAITAIFSLVSIGLFTATFFRFFDSFFSSFWPIFAGYTAFALVINLFLSFSPYYIVGDKEDVSASIKKSLSLVFMNFGTTLMIFLLMFLVNLRIILNVIVILGVPIGVGAAMTIFNSSTAFILSMLFGIFMIGLTAYLSAIVTVFATTVWFLVFEMLKQKSQQLDSDES